MFFVFCLELDEVMRLLKTQGIELGGKKAAEGSEKVSEKEKVWARHQERKTRNSERHVLNKTMATRHPLPALFVSRRSDNGPNGFNCAICKRDVSFLSRGEAEIWRHFRCQSHFVRDRRYRYDHEEEIFGQDFSATRVQDISEELREEILQTEPVSLGTKYRFVEDEVDGVVGVESQIPTSILVGCLFELLRTGGSQTFMRRLWALFRGGLPAGHAYSDASWSKTETLTILGQTLYPRIVR